MKTKKPPSVMSSSVLKGLCRFTCQPFLFSKIYAYYSTLAAGKKEPMFDYFRQFF